jgi:hypothetical protein
MGARLNPNSDAWGGAWGMSWGGSWGWSWGPLHEVEERPHEYRGNGRRLPGLPADPWRDASEADIEALVRDKWEAIEKATVKDPLPVAAKAIEPSKPGPAADVPETNFGKMAAPSIIAEHWPDAAALEAQAAIERAAYQASEDEALLLILAEML